VVGDELDQEIFGMLLFTRLAVFVHMLFPHLEWHVLRLSTTIRLVLDIQRSCL
jgi:hypothetical protein